MILQCSLKSYIDLLNSGTWLIRLGIIYLRCYFYNFIEQIEDSFLFLTVWEWSTVPSLRNKSLVKTKRYKFCILYTYNLESVKFSMIWNWGFKSSQLNPKNNLSTNFWGQFNKMEQNLHILKTDIWSKL